MAEGGLFKNIGYSNCPICLETLNVPRTLPCQHTFCQKCLTSFIVNHVCKQGEITSFHCPVCRTSILPSVENMDPNVWELSFPQNGSILTLSEDSKTRVDYVCDPCLASGDSKKAGGYYVDCNEHFCENCIDSHNRFKILTTHKLITLDELSQNRSTAVVSAVEDHCKVHGGKEIEYFCNDHEALCCVKCFLEDHRICKSVMDLSSNDNIPLEEHSKDIIDVLKLIDEHLVKYTEKNKSNLKILETNTKQLTVDLQKAKDRIVKLFDILEKEVKQVGDKLCQDENNNKSRENSQCQSFLVAVRQSYQLLDAVNRLGNKTKLYIPARQVKRQVANYTEQVVSKYRTLESKGISLTFQNSLKSLLSLQNKKLASVDIKDKIEELSLTGIVRTSCMEVIIVRTPCMEVMVKELASPIRENDSLYFNTNVTTNLLHLHGMFVWLMKERWSCLCPQRRRFSSLPPLFQ